MTWAKWSGLVASKQEVADHIVGVLTWLRADVASVHDAEAPSSDPGRIDIELTDGTRITLRVESVW